MPGPARLSTQYQKVGSNSACVTLRCARDISVLRGPKLLLGTRFETVKDARRYSLAPRDFLWVSR